MTKRSAEHLINRIGFWIATGSGKTPVIVKLIELLWRSLWPLLAEQGKLVYVTCSVLPEENEARIAAFLKEHPEARALAIDAPWGRCSGAGRQILPGESNMDGFFYAVLVK